MMQRPEAREGNLKIKNTKDKKHGDSLAIIIISRCAARGVFLCGKRDGGFSWGERDDRETSMGANQEEGHAGGTALGGW